MPDRMIKGRIAETIISEMLREANYKVYRFGYEGLLQDLTQPNTRIKGTAAEQIRTMPDFVILDEESNTSFVEVKYRATGELRLSWAKKVIKHWPETIIIMVRFFEKPYFLISTLKRFIENKKLYPLEDNEFIKIDKELIKKYEVLVNEFYV